MLELIILQHLKRSSCCWRRWFSEFLHTLRNKMSSHKKRFSLQPFDKTFAAGKVEIVAAQASCSIQTRNVRKTTEPQDFFFFFFSTRSDLFPVWAANDWKDPSTSPHVLLICANWQQKKGVLWRCTWQKSTHVYLMSTCGLSTQLWTHPWAVFVFICTSSLSNRSKVIKRLFLVPTSSSVYLSSRRSGLFSYFSVTYLLFLSEYERLIIIQCCFQNYWGQLL